MNKIATPGKISLAVTTDKVPAAKPAAPDGQPFGNVLAQQIGDSKPGATAEKSTDKRATKTDGPDKQPDTPTSPADAASNVIALIHPLLMERSAAAPAATVTAGKATLVAGDAQSATLAALAASATAGGTTAQPATPTVKTAVVQTDVLTVPLQGSPASPADAKPSVPASPFVAIVADKILSPDAHPAARDGLALAAAAREPVAQTLEQAVAAQLPGTAMLLPHAPASAPAMTTPLGKPGWTEEFTQKVSWMSNSQQDQFAEMHLNPPDLGPLSVVLKVSENQASVMFTSPHLAVREAVEHSLPKLREVLADSGITLGNTSVNDQAQRDGRSGTNRDARRDNDDRSGTGQPIVRLPVNGAGRRHDGMVDTYA